MRACAKLHQVKLGLARPRYETSASPPGALQHVGRLNEESAHDSLTAIRDALITISLDEAVIQSADEHSVEL